jgi:hypothetical protein
MTDFAGVLTGNVTGTTSGSLAIGTGGGATYSVQAKRIGDEAIVKYSIRVGTSGASDVVGAYLFPFPTGITPATFSVNETLGYGDVTVQATINPAARLICKAFGTGFIADVNDGLLLSGGGVLFTNANVTSMTIRYKVQGWSSNVQMSDSADTRVVDFIGAQSSQAVTANVTNIAFTTVKDSHGVWTGSTYVVIVPGDYVVNSSWLTSGTAAGAVYKDAAFFAYLGTGGAAQALAGSALVPCVAGTVLSVRSTGSVTVTSGAIGIYRLSGPSAIAATETVAFSAYNNANVDLSPEDNTLIPFINISVNTHNVLQFGDRVVFPIAGTYNINAEVAAEPTIGGVNPRQYYVVSFKKNNSESGLPPNRPIYWMDGTTQKSLWRINTIIKVKAGDFFEIYASLDQNSDGMLFWLNNINISKVGM